MSAEECSSERVSTSWIAELGYYIAFLGGVLCKDSSERNIWTCVSCCWCASRLKMFFSEIFMSVLWVGNGLVSSNTRSTSLASNNRELNRCSSQPIHPAKSSSAIQSFPHERRLKESMVSYYWEIALKRPQWLKLYCSRLSFRQWEWYSPRPIFVSFKCWGKVFVIPVKAQIQIMLKKTFGCNCYNV